MPLLKAKTSLKLTIPIIQTMSVVPEDSIIFKSNDRDSLLNEADHESFQENQIIYESISQKQCCLSAT